MVNFCFRNKITDSTPLHIATVGGHVDVIQLLLKHGASPLDENKVNMMEIADLTLVLMGIEIVLY